MKKILVAGTAVLMTAAAVVASTAPASAGGNFNFSIGVGGWGPGWHPGYGGVYVGGPIYGGGNAWAAHVNWCYNHKGPSYNPDTNTFVNYKGKVKYCNSPFT